mgnify:CR=1 FL=1
MVLPALSGTLGLALLALVTIALLKPERFQLAGKALTPFSTGFQNLLIAPLQPIGALGTELGEFGTGFKTAGAGIGQGISGIFSPIQDLVNWGLMVTGRSVTNGNNNGQVTTVPITPTPYIPRGAWADLPQTQLLENVLLKSGWIK